MTLVEAVNVDLFIIYFVTITHGIMNLNTNININT